MSIVAEFAADLHRHESTENLRTLAPFHTVAREERLYDIRVVIFDVYGTLINYWRPEFGSDEEKVGFLDEAFEKTAARFGMTEYLAAVNPADSPRATLRDFFHGLIALDHDKARKQGVEYPEVRIERIWELIVLMLMRHGYQPSGLGLGGSGELARCIAYYYNFHALGRGLFPGVVDSLKTLQAAGMKLGIVSNAQFYTPIDLTLFLRDQSADEVDDYLELFDVDLVVMSYELGKAKPNLELFERLFDALYQLNVLPQQVVFVGNDLASDIAPAQQVGMRTAFFSGDRISSFTHGLEGTVIPDIAFSSWDELPGLISFHEEGSTESAGAARG